MEFELKYTQFIMSVEIARQNLYLLIEQSDNIVNIHVCMASYNIRFSQ